MADKDGKTYLPKINTRRGVAGYRGRNIVVMDKDGKADKNAVKKPVTDRD